MVVGQGRCARVVAWVADGCMWYTQSHAARPPRARTRPLRAHKHPLANWAWASRNQHTCAPDGARMVHAVTQLGDMGGGGERCYLWGAEEP